MKINRPLPEPIEKTEEFKFTNKTSLNAKKSTGRKKVFYKKIKKPIDEVFDKISGLTAREKSFVREYIKDYNGVRAGLRIGIVNYATAGDWASAALKKAKVQEAINEYEKSLSTRFINTKEKILKELSLNAHSDIVDYNSLLVDSDSKKGLKKLPPQVSRAIKKLNIKRVTTTRYAKDGSKIVEVNENSFLELYDKNTALQLMGKEIGMFKEIKELTGPDGQPLNSVPTTIILDFGE